MYIYLLPFFFNATYDYDVKNSVVDEALFLKDRSPEHVTVLVVLSLISGIFSSLNYPVPSCVSMHVYVCME